MLDFLMLDFLLSIADENDRSKVEEIYEKYNEVMYKAALRKLSGRPNAAYEAEDAVQNAFVKIINHFQSIRFDECEERLESYFVSIATNEAMNILRKKKSISLDDLPEEMISDDDFVAELCMKDEYERVRRAILQLDDRYRPILFQYFVEEKRGPEIAELMDMNLSTVHTTIQRGKELLLKILKGDL